MASKTITTNSRKKSVPEVQAFRRIFEGHTALMMLLDPLTSVILDANQSAINFYGYPKLKLCGQAINRIDGFPQGQAAAEYQKEKNGEQIRNIFTHRLASGEVHIMEIYSSPLVLQGKQVLFCILHDVSKCEQAETKLRESEYRMELAQTVAHVGSWELNLTTRSMWASAEAFRIYGLEIPPGQFIPLALAQKLPVPHQRSRLDEALKNLIYENMPYDLEFQINRGDDDTIRTVHSKAQLISDDLGKPMLVVGTIQDITERKQRTRELEAVAKISAALRLSQTRAEMLPIIAEQVAALVNAASVALLLNDPQTNEFVIEHAQGVWLKDVGQHFPRHAAILRLILDQGKPFITNDLPRDPIFLLRDSIHDLHGFAEIPLVREDEIIGFLAVASRGVFSDEDISILVTISDIAANAMHRASLHEKTKEYAANLAQAYDSALEGWVHALEMRDQETEGHTRRVVQMAVDLARAIGIAEDELEYVRRGALLHDIGKMGIPDSILLKPGGLNEQEWEIMRQHPEHALRLLGPIEYLRPVLDIPYCHHEKWDGTGYPRSLAGEQIPLAARLFAVADVWDALTSDRPYRPAWTREKSITYITDQKGRHFDPQIVNVFLKMI